MKSRTSGLLFFVASGLPIAAYVWTAGSSGLAQDFSDLSRFSRLAWYRLEPELSRAASFVQGWSWSAFERWNVYLIVSLLVVLVVILLAIVRRRITRESTASKANQFGFQMRRSLQRQKRISVSVIVVFLGGFLAWSSVFAIASATIAPGVVSPEGNKRPIQHLEGGIVAEVLVKDGDRVAMGQPILVMEDVRAKSRVAVFEDQKKILAMRLDRLTAEREGKVLFVPQRLAEPNAELERAIASEIQQFLTRDVSMRAQKEILEARILQHRETEIGLEAQIVALETQRDKTREHLEMTIKLADQGLSAKTQVLALESSLAAVEGQIAAAKAQVARTKKMILETEREIAGMRSKFLEEVDAQISEVRSQLVRIESDLTADSDVLDRTTIAAQENGTVIGLRVTVPGAVVKPGDVLLEIVPDEAKLLIDARVSPLDIDDIQVGQSAQVQLSAYRQRRMPRINGYVQYVSADRFTDERNGLPFFLARIAIDPVTLKNVAPDVAIVAGMPAEVMIQTGEQTLIDYLVGPLSQSLNRTFREK
jgi:HlyD family secretion protein